MNSMELREILATLGLEQNISLQDIPNIDLYMDQLITLFEDKLQHTKRYEEDKLLTKTMINNYTKDKVLMPANKKKYTKQHIILMILIYEMKQVLSIGDIKILLSHFVEGKISDAQLDIVYESYLKCKQIEKGYFDIGIEKRVDIIKEEIGKLGLEENNETETMLMAMSLITQAAYHKRLAEALIDSLVTKKVKKNK